MSQNLAEQFNQLRTRIDELETQLEQLDDFQTSPEVLQRLQGELESLAHQMISLTGQATERAPAGQQREILTLIERYLQLTSTLKARLHQARNSLANQWQHLQHLRDMLNSYRTKQLIHRALDCSG